MSTLDQRADGTWWFWDETWTDDWGPYDTQDEAQMMLNAYCRVVLDGVPPTPRLDWRGILGC